MVISRVRRAGVAAAALSTVALTISACGRIGSSGTAISGSSGTEISVVASTDVYGDIVSQVAGDLAGNTVKITSIISDPAQDPHSYEANATTQLELSKAAIVIENGGGYDDFIGTMLKGSGNASAKIINVVGLSGKTAPAGGGLNEHVWYDFPTVQKLAGTIAEDLGAASPSDAAAFSANAVAFTRKVGALQAEESAIKKAHAGVGVAVTEPVPLYLLEACGLVNRTPPEFSEAVEEGTDVPAAVLNQTLKLFSTGEVKVLAYNEQTAGPETEKVLDAAKTNKVGVVPVTETLPAGKNYLTWMSSNLAALTAALV